MSVTVVAVIYGFDYWQFEMDWRRSLHAMVPPADDVILHHGLLKEGELYPQARLLNEAIAKVATDWVWPLNVDDLALPDALAGLEEQDAQVWLMGMRSGKQDIVPEAMSNADYLANFGNPYPSMSAFRKQAWELVGGYPTVGHEDWALWRRMALAGLNFSASGRDHSIYRDHPLQRTKTDVRPELWERHKEEMLGLEEILAYTV
jgi:hypothetical protein